MNLIPKNNFHIRESFCLKKAKLSARQAPSCFKILIVITSILIFGSWDRSASAAVYQQNFTFANGTSDLKDGSVLTPNNTYKPQVVNGKLKLSDVNKGGAYSFYQIPALAGSRLGWTAQYEMTIQGAAAGFAADGVYFSYQKQDGQGSYISYSVDTWDNGYPGVDQGISAAVKVGSEPGKALYYRPFSPLGGSSSVTWTVKLEWDPIAGISMWINGNREFGAIPTPGFNPDDNYIFLFTGAVGQSIAETVLLDNLVITTKAPPKAVLTTLQSQGGTISGAGEYAVGSNASIVASGLSGYVFSRWTGDASGSVNPLQVVMNSPKTIGAEFSPDMSDTDSDGLTAYDEVIVFGTDPAVADTDQDGITDGEETGVGVFSVVDGIFTWEQARVDAMAKGGRLATFGSALEWQGALRSIGSDALVGRIGIWLGATDQVEEGAWRWVTGEPFTFQNWAEGEPDNANDSDFADVAGTE